MPTTLVAEAVFARIVSALKDERIAASGLLTGPRGDVLDGLAPNTPAGTRREIAAHKKSIWVEKLEQAVYAAKIISYAQGFMLLRAAAVEYGWDLDYGRIASLWREGCIIRAAFLDDITAAYATDPHLTNLMLDPFFRQALAESEKGLAGDGPSGRQDRHPRPRLFDGAGLLRLVPVGTVARQPDPGPAGLLRRPHLRADRPAPRRVLPHQLDGNGRRHDGGHLRGVTQLNRGSGERDEHGPVLGAEARSRPSGDGGQLGAVQQMIDRNPERTEQGRPGGLQAEAVH